MYGIGAVAGEVRIYVAAEPDVQGALEGYTEARARKERRGQFGLSGVKLLSRLKMDGRLYAKIAEIAAVNLVDVPARSGKVETES